jgi:plasmid stabilization system protein ParE
LNWLRNPLLARGKTPPHEPLAEHPLVGRATNGELRELVISFGRTGYVALYRFFAERSEIRILGIRHQRELDYPG